MTESWRQYIPTPPTLMFSCPWENCTVKRGPYYNRSYGESAIALHVRTAHGVVQRPAEDPMAVDSVQRSRYYLPRRNRQRARIDP